MDYLRTIERTLIKANRKAYHEAIADGRTGHKHGKAKAWDNKKRKNAKRYLPRGKVYKRLLVLESRRVFAEITKSLNDAEHINKLRQS